MNSNGAPLLARRESAFDEEDAVLDTASSKKVDYWPDGGAVQMGGGRRGDFNSLVHLVHVVRWRLLSTIGAFVRMGVLTRDVEACAGLQETLHFWPKQLTRREIDSSYCTPW